MWALRKCAEQDNPSNTFGFLKTEVVAMAKQVFSWARSLVPAALVCAGWFAFIGGVSVEALWLRLMLLSVARVLPTALILETLEYHQFSSV